jgi:hypothetical protein
LPIPTVTTAVCYVVTGMGGNVVPDVGSDVVIRDGDWTWDGKALDKGWTVRGFLREGPLRQAPLRGDVCKDFRANCDAAPSKSGTAKTGMTAQSSPAHKMVLSRFILPPASK